MQFIQLTNKHSSKRSLSIRLQCYAPLVAPWLGSGIQNPGPSWILLHGATLDWDDSSWSFFNISFAFTVICPTAVRHFDDVIHYCCGSLRSVSSAQRTFFLVSFLIATLWRLDPCTCLLCCKRFHIWTIIIFGQIRLLLSPRAAPVILHFPGLSSVVGMNVADYITHDIEIEIL